MISTFLRRRFASQVFVQGFPAEWNADELTRRFGTMDKLQKVHMVRNEQGLKSGKAVLTFVDDSAGDRVIKMFDNKAVDNLICRVTPFF